MATLIHELIFDTARRAPDAPALSWQGEALAYGALAQCVRDCAWALLALGLARGARVAVYLEKRPENVSAMFGAAAAGGVFVPVNPLLKPEQVAYILADCNVAILVTSRERLAQLGPALAACPDLRTVLLTGERGLDASLDGV
ncbi:MAG: AMP-binding protein, partial [Janthinobacterium sp.]